MGLDTTHDAFHGAYSAFHRFRKAVCKAAGGSFPPHDNPALDSARWYIDEPFTQETHPGLYLFLSHSDCDGDLSPDECTLVADDLEKLLPAIEKTSAADDWGHIAARGGLVEVTKKFIAGCRLAAANRETLEFR